MSIARFLMGIKRNTPYKQSKTCMSRAKFLMGVKRNGIKCCIDTRLVEQDFFVDIKQ